MAAPAVPAAPANVIRGFSPSPAGATRKMKSAKVQASANGNTYGNNTENGLASPNRQATPVVQEPTGPAGANGRPITPTQTRRGRTGLRPDDVVSANCSPVLRGASSPGLSGIAKLRMQVGKHDLDGTSRASSPMTRSVSRQGRLDYISGFNSSRPQSRNGRRSSTGSECTTSYEIPLENEFVSASVGGPDSRTPTMSDATSSMYGAIEGGLIPRKVAADDFEPLRCLGKGAYGTVILVKQKDTGRLYAQKQFKKASMIVRKHLIEQTKTERQILESINRHAFVVKLYYAFQDQEKLYLILEYGQGGELFHHLRVEHMFSVEVASFYMAEMVLALSYLHESMGVIYRDLKPENCLLDAEGHLLLTDFGLSKVAVDNACTSMSGTTEYLAPEVIKSMKYGKAVDWWALGVLGFELMTGNVPFRGPTPAKVQSNIVRMNPVFPYYLGPDAKDLLTRLLRKQPAKRLGGNMPGDLDVIKGHRFFKKINWNKLAHREVEPPIQPVITDPELAENFDREFTELSLSPIATRKGGFTDKEASYQGKEDPFGGFSFMASSSLLENYGGNFPSGEDGR